MRRMGQGYGNYLAHTFGNYEGGGTDVKMIEGG